MFYLPCDLMRKSDTASMAVPLEVRSPMLQVDLARAAINAPVRDLMPRGSGMGGRKGLLRQVARQHLPAEIVDRPKMGFAIPIGEWFRSDYGGLRTMLLDHLNSTEPFGPPSLGIDLNMNFVRQMLDEHLGSGPSGLVKRDHSQRLYMLLVLSIWAKWLGGLAGSLPRT
jgi:asparagine synthase (glutamine-hydrolysing)